MRNLKLLIEYDGSGFHGWQKQQSLRTVQGEIEETFFKLTGETVSVEGSGRTDKGVHALGQVASVQLENSMPIKNFKKALNNLLPPDVRIKRVESVSADFHARFSAKRKTYEYLVQIGGEREALKHDKVALFPYVVDVLKMQEVAKLLIGKHDFRGFCASDTSVHDFVREIFELKVEKRGKLCKFIVTGNGFLYNMVRIIVGTLLEVGRGRLTNGDVEKALKLGDRKFAGRTMEACGLYLKKVEYI